jgi:hypothetical protein
LKRKTDLRRRLLIHSLKHLCPLAAPAAAEEEGDSADICKLILVVFQKRKSLRFDAKQNACNEVVYYML